MVKCIISDKAVLTQKSDGLLFFVHENFSFKKEFVDVAKLYFPHLETLFKTNKFEGKLGQRVSVQGSSKEGIKHLLFVGLGSKKKTAKYMELEDFRRILGASMRWAETVKISSLACEVPATAVYGHGTEFMVRTMTTTFLMAEYQFDDFISNDAKVHKLDQIIFVAPKKDDKAAHEGARVGTIIAEAVNRSRHWVDLPANVITPPELAKRAKKLAKDHNLEITVFDEKEIEKLGMGGIKAVGMGSQHDAQLVIMQYTAKKKNAPTLALVGKGITFDSGGLNLKPTGFMETMKVDMTGAAAVINAIAALSQLKPDINVVVLAPLAENMVSGNANHPGDIIRFYNGKTAVVGNTDAEGRLVLADALAYASKHFTPTAMIDVATLTGAVSHAVGPFFSGVLTQDDDLAQRVQQAGETSGDATWRLPMIDRYKVMVKSDIADINNDGKSKYYAGPTNGACFLSHFVGETPWVHVDIAAAADEVPDTPYYRGIGATGVGTRLLIDFVMQWK